MGDGAALVTRLLLLGLPWLIATWCVWDFASDVRWARRQPDNQLKKLLAWGLFWIVLIIWLVHTGYLAWAIGIYYSGPPAPRPQTPQSAATTLMLGLSAIALLFIPAIFKLMRWRAEEIEKSRRQWEDKLARAMRANGEGELPPPAG